MTIRVWTSRAAWLSGRRALGGIDWIDDMAQRNEALWFSNVGYPEIYVTSALNIKSALRFGVPKANSPPVIGTDPVLRNRGRPRARSIGALPVCRGDGWHRRGALSI